MPERPHTAGSVANRLLDIAEVMRIDITHLTLHKLLFLAHGVYLNSNKRPLIKEHFEAWQYGPVLPSIYKFYQPSGRSVLSNRVSVRDLRTNQLVQVASMVDSGGDDAIFGVLASYGKKSAGFLVDLTHNPGGPWRKTLDKSRTGPTIGLKITETVILQNFRSMFVPIRGTDEPRLENTDPENLPFAGHRSR